MARIRTLKPEFWSHPKVVACSRDARLLFVGLINEADDAGKMRWSAKRIAGALFCEDDDVAAPEIEAWTSELEAQGLVRRYEIDGLAYLLVVGFLEHQKVSHPTPSRLPDPPDSDTGCPVPSGTMSPEEIANGSGAPPEALRPERKGREGKGTGSTGGRGATAVPDPYPVTDEERAWASEQVPGVSIEHEAAKMVNWAKSKGIRRKDWAATLRNWCIKAHEDASGRNGSNGNGAPKTRVVDGNLERFYPGTGWVRAAT